MGGGAWVPGTLPCVPCHNHPQKLLMLREAGGFLGHKSEMVSVIPRLSTKGLALSSSLSDHPERGPKPFLVDITTWAWGLLHTVHPALKTTPPPPPSGPPSPHEAHYSSLPNLTHQTSCNRLAPRFDQRPDTKSLSGSALRNTLGPAKGGRQRLDVQPPALPRSSGKVSHCIYRGVLSGKS